MKRIILTVFVCLVLFSGESFADLIAHYTLDGNAEDVTGSGNDGIINGATEATDRFGNVDGAYHFDGVDDYITFEHNPLLSSWNSDFSISLWLKMDSAAFPAKWALFFGNDRKGTMEEEYLGISVINSVTLNDVLSGIVVRDTIDESYYDRANTSTADLDTWHNLTAVIKNDTMYLYLNGSLVSSKEADYNLTELDGDNFTIGAMRWDNSYVDFINAYLDDIRIYDHALSGTEVITLNGNTVPEPTTILLLGTGLLGLSGVRRRLKS